MNSNHNPKRLRIGHVIFWLLLVCIGIKVTVFGALMMLGLFPHEVVIAFVTKLWTLGPTFLVTGLTVSAVGYLIVGLCIWQLMRMSAACHKRDEF